MLWFCWGEPSVPCAGSLVGGLRYSPPPHLPTTALRYSPCLPIWPIRPTFFGLLGTLPSTVQCPVKRGTNLILPLTLPTYRFQKWVPSQKKLPIPTAPRVTARHKQPAVLMETFYSTKRLFLLDAAHQHHHVVVARRHRKGCQQYNTVKCLGRSWCQLDPKANHPQRLTVTPGPH